MKLNQLIAIINGVKQASAKSATEVYQLCQKPALFQGLSRTYSPREEDGYVYPTESQKITFKAKELIAKFVDARTEFFDLAATQDYANTEAKASIVVDGVTVLADVPVPYLLFLEKQLQDVKTFVGSIPVLAIDKEWDYDANRDCYVTDPKLTTKTKKITKPVVLYEATKEHPAQVKEVSEDVIEGTWSLIEFSGALPASRINELKLRVDALLKAVVQAREEANGMEVVQKKAASAIFNYLFAD
jgi:hypothetical protein